MPDPVPAAKVGYVVKEEHGLPVGSGAHNSMDRWNSVTKPPELAHTTASAVVNTVPLVMGADFLLYGPIEKAAQVYTTAAVADAFVAYSTRQEYGVAPLVKNHPLSRVFQAAHAPPC